MEDKYQMIMDEENKRLNERIAKIERQHKRIKHNLYTVAIIIIGVTIYCCSILS